MDNLSFPGGADAGDKKSFWSKPEGKASLFIWAGIGAVVFYYWGLILPFIILTLTNTLYAGILLGVLGLLIYLLTDKQFRTMIWYLYKTIMRGLAGIIIQTNPIAILKTYIRDLQDKQREMSGKIDELAGAKEKLGQKMRDNATQARDHLAKAAKAQQMGNTQAASLHAMQAGGLQEMNEKLSPLFNNMQKLQDFLEKVFKAADFVIKQTQIQVELKEAEYDAIKSSSKALRSAMSIFKGDPDKKQMFEQSLEYIQDDMAKKVGEMKRIMKLSTEFMDNADIESGVNYDKGMALLDQYMSGQKLSLLTDSEPAGTLPSRIIVTPALGQSSTPSLIEKKADRSNSEWS